MHPTWFVRLKAKSVFAEIWKTHKLLTSFDAIAIGRPPEDGQEEFDRPGQHWLHLDQVSEREGLHCYQGSVYLEQADEDDWTFEVMDGSHLEFESFYAGNKRATIRAKNNEFYCLLDEEVIELRAKCPIKRVAVPKGGIALWDSRLVHANARPIKGRKNPGRWRYCVFVSMAPAIWASKRDIKLKQKAYNDVLMTTHWPSQGVRTFSKEIPSFSSQDVAIPSTVPDIAKSKEAMMLAGVIPYDFKDGGPTGEEFRPKWSDGQYGKPMEYNKKRIFGLTVSAVIVCGIAYLVYRSKSK